MGGVFGRERPLKEVLRENKRQISRAIRELEREQRQLEKNEQTLKKDIKKAAQAGQMNSVRIMAKDLIRTRNYVTRFIEMKSHLQGVSLQLQTIKSHEALSSAMRSVTKAMVRMNKQVNVPSLNKIIRDFARENERAEMTQEMMGDMIDDTLGSEGDAEEEAQVVNQVLAELNIGTDEMLVEAPDAVQQSAVSSGEQKTAAAVAGGGGGGGGPSAGVGDNDMADLEARLNNLRR